MIEERRVRNQGKLVIGLTKEEMGEAKRFWDRSDCQNSASGVKRIVEVVDSVAKEYLSSKDVDRIDVLIGLDSKMRIPIPFFSVYGIGGMVTKQGNRPDIDLLVATNMRYFSEEELPKSLEEARDGIIFNGEYQTSPNSRIHERLLKPLLVEMAREWEFRISGKLPNSYKMGNVKDKLLLRFAPLRGIKGLPIDLAYVNCGIQAL